MGAEVWFRNPHDYVRELVEVGANQIAWDRGTLAKKKMDPHKHGLLYYGGGDFRALVIGEQGAADIDLTHDLTNPRGVYPVWTYGEELHILEDYLVNPPGLDEAVCATKGVAPDELPVLGQESRVIITGLPPGSQYMGKSILRQLKEFQEDYPESIIHLHGPYSWRVAFGTGMRSADVQPRENAAKGKITLPNGSEVPYEKVFNKGQWVRAVGFEPEELKVPRNRCMFNIKSAMWAGEHYAELFKFQSTKSKNLHVDPYTPAAAYVPPTTKSHMSTPVKKLPTDLYTCDTCSLMNSCKYARDGAVCAVPNSEPAPLTSYFGTRDSGMILDGLAILMQSGIKRYERGLMEENVTGDLIPEVTRIQKAAFDQGTKLAKLLDPSLRGSAAVQVNVGGGSAVQVNSGSPRQAIAAAMRELEARGIPRDQITPEMMQGVFESMNSQPAQQRAIEATVIEHSE